MAESEYHVASFVVRTRPQHGAAVAERIRAVPGLEVHAEEQGKLIVTGEASNVRTLAELTENLEAIEAVLAVAPVYHEFSSAEETAAPVSREER